MIDEIKILLEEAHNIRINNLSKSISLAKKALNDAKEIKHKPLMAKAYSQLGLYYMVTSEMDIATNYSKKAIRIYTKLNDEKGVADAKYSLAGVYYKTNLYHLGLMCFIDSLKIYQKYNDYTNQSRTEKSLGTIYEFIGDQKNALKSYRSGINNAKKVNDTNLESNIYNNLSGIYAKNGKLKFAMNFIDKSIELKTKTNDERGLAFAIYGKGKVYYHLNDFENAKKHYLLALDLHEKMSDITGITMAYTKLAELYFKSNDLVVALENATKGLELANNLNLAMSTIKLNRLMYLIYKEQQIFDKALYFLEKHLAEKEMVINIQTLKVIENYELISKMEVLKNDSELQRERETILLKKAQDEHKIMKMRQEFLSIMSHEIRTPLNAITSIVALLKDEVNSEGKDLLNSLNFASNTLIKIVNNVLDYTKLDSNKTKLELTPVNINTLVSNVVKVYDKEAIDKNLNLIINTNLNETFKYNLDETKIIQVLNNLVNNAIKFTDVGSVEINVNRVIKGIKKDTILFEVKDSGEGISDENIKEIFIDFSQVKPVLTRKHGGTGLGLAIVKKIINLHKSEIKVKSILGQGTTFYFELQLTKTNTTDKIVAVKNKLNSILENKKILIVEDTVINAVLLAKLLSKWKIITTHVENGKLALEKVAEEKYDIILMDIHMPDMNGFEVTKNIKTKKNINKSTPIIALTADTMLNSENYEINLFDGYLWKPFEIQKLKEVLQSVL